MHYTWGKIFGLLHENSTLFSVMNQFHAIIKSTLWGKLLTPQHILIYKHSSKITRHLQIINLDVCMNLRYIYQWMTLNHWWFSLDILQYSHCVKRYDREITMYICVFQNIWQTHLKPGTWGAGADWVKLHSMGQQLTHLYIVQAL